MVGGTVIGIARHPDVTLLHVADCPHHPKHSPRPDCPAPDTCSVRCREVTVRDNTPVEVRLGDQIWWQAGQVYWTPADGNRGGRCGVDFDMALPKVGYSH